METSGVADRFRALRQPVLTFVDYYVHIKNAEIERFQAEVSDWEHREYFEMF